MKYLTAAFFLIFIHSVGNCADIYYGNWVFSVNENSFLLATTNQSGESMLLACQPDNDVCEWGISLKIGCDINHNYIMLISAPDGIVSAKTVCARSVGNGKSVQYVHKFIDTNIVSLLGDKQGYVGFAIGLQDGTFQISRFSLNGLSDGFAALDKLLQSYKASSTKTKYM